MMATRGWHHTRYVPALIHDSGVDQHYRAGMPVEESAVRRLAQAIKGARDKLDWTQDKLAEVAGVSRPTVQRYENAKSKYPEPEPVRRIFKALGLNPKEIPVILGLVTREEMGLPPEPVRKLSATVEEIVALLEDPDVSEAEKLAWVEVLRAQRNSRRRDDPPGDIRRAG